MHSRDSDSPPSTDGFSPPQDGFSLRLRLLGRCWNRVLHRVLPANQARVTGSCHGLATRKPMCPCLARIGVAPRFRRYLGLGASTWRCSGLPGTCRLQPAYPRSQAESGCWSRSHRGHGRQSWGCSEPPIATRLRSPLRPRSRETMLCRAGARRPCRCPCHDRGMTCSAAAPPTQRAAPSRPPPSPPRRTRPACIAAPPARAEAQVGAGSGALPPPWPPRS